MGVLSAATAPPRLPTEAVVADGDRSRAAEAYAALLARIPALEDAAVATYVAGVGNRIAAAAPPINVTFRFTVLDSEGCFAYSFADGQVVVSRGMLAYLNSADELAAVLAHEVAHVLGLHQARQFAQFRRAVELESKLRERFASGQAREALGALTTARLRGYSREQEFEADNWGEQLLRRAGYAQGSSARMLRFLDGFEQLETASGGRLWQLPDEADLAAGGNGVFATHPSTAARLGEMERSAPAKADAPVDAEFLARLNGLAFGVSARVGIRRDDIFVASRMDVAWPVPAGWYVFGSDDSIVIAPADNRVLLRLQGASAVGNASERLAALAGQASPPAAGREGPSGALIAELPATEDSRTRLVAVVDIDTSRIEADARAASAEDWARHGDAVRTVLRSLRRPLPAERAWQPVRIGVTENAPLAAPPGIGLRAGELEFLNRSGPGAPPRWTKQLR